MGSLGWQNPAFLMAAIVAVLPILIHLVGRKRIEQVTFGAFRFLRKHAERVVRRHRFLEFLLVLLRCLALAGLALAFAYPFLRSGNNPDGSEPGANSATLLLVDASWSMRSPGKMEAARKQARAALDKLPGDCAAGVATFAGNLSVVAPLSRDLVPARDAVDKIQPGTLSGNLNRALEEAGRLLDRTTATQKRVVLVSDMSARAWDRKEPLKLPGAVKLVLEALPARESKDLNVRQVVVPPVVLAGGFEQDIIAEVANETAEQRANVTVNFYIGGKSVEKRAVNLRPKSTSLVRFRQRFETPGETIGRVVIEVEDEMKENNEVAFVIPVLPRVQVLLINGDPDSNPTRNDGFFLAKALSPDASSPVNVREVPAEKWDPASLKDMDVVMLANVGKLPEASIAALEKFMLAGGGLAAFMGKYVVPEEFNAGLARLFPCKLREIQEAQPEQPLSIGAADFSHEIFQSFDGPHNGNFASARFTKYFEIKDSQAAHVLARFNAVSAATSLGAPVLLARTAGRGRSVLFTSAVDLEWNDFCLKAVFLPFAQETTRWLCRQRLQASQNRIAGQTVRHSLPAVLSEVELKLPSGSMEKLPVRAAAGGDDAAPEKLGVVEFTPQERGVYTLTAGSEKWNYAVNLPPEEMDAAQFDPRELTSAVAAQEDAARAEGGAVAEIAPLRKPLWTLALGIVCALLVAEMILATYLART